MSNFMKDTPFGILYSEHQKNAFFECLQLIQLKLEGYVTSIRQRKQDIIKRNTKKLYGYDLTTTHPELTETDISKLTKEVLEDNEVTKKVTGMLMGDFGRARKGFPTGGVSRALGVIQDKYGNNIIDLDGRAPKSVYNIEHFIPLGQVLVPLMIYDYLTGVWKFKVKDDGRLGELEKGQNRIEYVYPLANFTILVSVEENRALIKIVDDIKEECRVDGIIDMDMVLEKMMAGEHYERADIVLHDKFLDVKYKNSGTKIYPEHIPEGMKRLMGKKPKKKKSDKIKKVKQLHHWW
tara:strand:+ start:2851 stop:3729 length:879 start_codon:yes stop_codon:yes gene_type:complete